MIAQQLCPIIFDANDQAHILSLAAPLGRTWDRPSSRTRTLKNKIREQLDSTQTACAYCGLELGGTSGGEIEHIAAKGRNAHPEFTYIRENLVLACDFCNGPKKKFQKETIATKVQNYQACIFLVVHPYFDNPDDHYSWVDNAKRILIQSTSPKGAHTIEMFELDSPKMTRFRAMEYNAHVTLSNLTLDQQTENHLKQALAFK